MNVTCTGSKWHYLVAMWYVNKLHVIILLLSMWSCRKMVHVRRDCLMHFMIKTKRNFRGCFQNYIAQNPFRVVIIVGNVLLSFILLSGMDHVRKKVVEEDFCDPTAADDDGFSPLHIACAWGRPSPDIYLISLPSVWKTVYIKIKNDIHLACLRGNLEVIQTLLQTTSINISEDHNDGFAPIELLYKYS